MFIMNPKQHLAKHVNNYFLHNPLQLGFFGAARNWGAFINLIITR
jgi:hypothetical protein